MSDVSFQWGNSSPRRVAAAGRGHRSEGFNMSGIRNTFKKLLGDDRGGEVLEYALIAGLIVVAAIAIIGTVGTKVLARWTSLNDSL
jgi:pilus assembly protein Flp/PilA